MQGSQDITFDDLFWDCDRQPGDEVRYRSTLVRRALAGGTWEQIQALRKQLGDAAIKQEITATRGRQLSPRQLRFWQLVLKLPDEDVDAWLASPGREVWDRRAG